MNCSVHVRIGLQVVGRDAVRAFHEGVVNSKKCHVVSRYSD